MRPAPQDWNKLRVFPLDLRTSLTTTDQTMIAPDTDPPAVSDESSAHIARCAADVARARAAGAGVILMYGAHLVKNGAAPIVNALIGGGWLSHLATNGAGTIHDWEFSWLGRSTESVRANVATGTFGAWEETGRHIQQALLAGGVRGEGYGTALGRYVEEDGADFPAAAELEAQIAADPANPLTAARADLLQAMRLHGVPEGRVSLEYRWKHASILAGAYRCGVPFTVHPGIGYDIIANHPIYSGAVVGRAAGTDFRLFGDSVETLDGGVVLSVGSAIMAPQVFEKSLSNVNNLRLAAGRPVVKDLTIYVVDLQDGGNWDWTQGEPPRDSPAYYLRFCKSFSRMGGTMHYVQCDNVAFVHNLLRGLAEG